jgi:hypothetical protein
MGSRRGSSFVAQNETARISWYDTSQRVMRIGATTRNC